MVDHIPRQAHWVSMPASEHVVVPGGVMPRRNVMMVKPGQVLRPGQNATPWTAGDIDVPKPSGRSLSRLLGPHWVGGWGYLHQASQPLARFDIAWEVPKAPAVHRSQTLFLSASLESPDFGYTLASVLTWGRSADGFDWRLSSWLISDDWAATSPSVPVESGSVVHACAELDSSGPARLYRFGFTGHPETTLGFAGGPDMVWACAGLQFHDGPANVAAPGRRGDAYLGGVTGMRAFDPHLEPATRPSRWTPIWGRGARSQEAEFTLGNRVPRAA